MENIKHKDAIIKIVEIFFPQAKIYLFGSYARGDNKRGSDIDIAIDNGQALPIVQQQQIKNMIECLNMIQNVNVVDFRSVPEKLQQAILKEGIVWKN